MSLFYFVSDLHGRQARLEKLLRILGELPSAALLVGGDILPGMAAGFIKDAMLPQFRRLRKRLGSLYPQVGIIPGNDDPAGIVTELKAGERSGAWRYLHGRKETFAGFTVFGYACVPPTPFVLKDWERYDVSRYAEPGSIPPEEGTHTVRIPDSEMQFGTIQEDLEKLFAGESLEKAICLFHAPPHSSRLDRAALDGCMVDHAPLDVHVGSVAVRRFIEERQPLLTLHGHVHESARLTGTWRDRIGRTHCFTAAHDGPELALVVFDPGNLEAAERRLL